MHVVLHYGVADPTEMFSLSLVLNLTVGFIFALNRVLSWDEDETKRLMSKHCADYILRPKFYLRTKFDLFMKSPIVVYYMK